MPDKQKSSQKSRTHKESKGTARGARKFPNGGMNELEKVLIANGGMGHMKLRKSQSPIQRARQDKF